MSNTDNLRELKTAARRIARARRITHVGALEIVAKCLGYPHWHALASVEKRGWRPTPSELAKANDLADAENPLISIFHKASSDIEIDEWEGAVRGQRYQVSIEDDDVRIWGRGWEILLPEAPLARALFHVTDRRIKDNPIDDAEFRDEIAELAIVWRKRVHARIASDWPRRSTVPDSSGRAEHPLGGAVSATWHCMHCDGSANSAEITANLFHCPHCLASPLDIHATQWWHETFGST